MLFDDKTKSIAQRYLSMLGESHYQVGDKVKCVASGMTGTVTKLDKPETGKYYTVKTDAGKEMKYAPDELKKLSEAIEIEVPTKSKNSKDMKHDDADEEMVAGDIKVKKKSTKDDQKKSADQIAEGYEVKVLNYLKKNGVQARFSNSVLYVDKDDMNDVKDLMKKAKRENLGFNPDVIKMKDKAMMYKEGVDQIDEISKKTLGSYIRKASFQSAVAGRSYGQGSDKDKKEIGKTQVKRERGIAKATDRLTKEDVDLSEMKYGKEYSEKQILDKIKSGDWEAMNDVAPGKNVELKHHSGKRVTVKIKESVDQIDELSKDTLRSYSAKAQMSVPKDERQYKTRSKGIETAEKKVKNVDESSLKDIRAAAEKRAGSVMKPTTPRAKPTPRPGSIQAIRADAERRKMREDVDQIDELSTSTLQSYRDKTGGSVNKRVSPTASKTDVQRKDRNQRVGRSSADNKIIKKAFEDYQWNWNAILEAPENEIDELIDQLEGDDLDSFLDEFESLQENKDMSKVAKEIEAYAKKSGGVDRADMLKVAAMLNRGQVKQALAFAKTLDTDPRDYILTKMGMMEGTRSWFQASTLSTQPEDEDGKEELEPRADADKAFVDAHKQMVDVKDYPGKDKPVTNAKAQSPLRRGDKRSSESLKTLSDIRKK